jgi:hypothetical protein
MSVAITALVIAAVVIFNVIFSALAAKFGWFIDLTKEGIYTLSDNCIELLDTTFEKISAERGANGEEPLKVKIRFCDLEDNLMANTTQRYVLMTAKELAEKFPDVVEIEYINIWENPTAVEKYKTSVLSAIYSTHVIIESGSEYRAYDIGKFYLTNTNSTTPWAYFGEKRFASGILAVTQAESPVAAVLTGHGEIFTDTALLETLDMAGYEVITIKDLTTEEIPDECRLMVCYNPTSDFIDADGIADKSEITVLDDFLADNNHSLMVFMNPTSPKLPIFESYLELWGISFMREKVDENRYNPYTVKDSANALTGDGLTFIADYVKLGLGGSITTDLRQGSVPRKVIFKKAMPIAIADEYNVLHAEENGDTVTYGYKDLGSGFARETYFIFNSSPDAVAMANGKEALKASANSPLGLMTISRQQRLAQEDKYGISVADLSSYVIACGSTEFVSKTLLESNTYGNSELLMKVFYEIGKENIPASLSIKPFSDTTIDTLTVDSANAYTAVLTIIPSLIVFGIGIFVIVRRKYS